MAKNEKAKKIPGALVAAVVVIIAIIAFVPTVYLPYKEKKPGMDAAHQEALDTIAYYDKSIENQPVIEAEIADLQKQWEKYQKDMFVDHTTALADINNAIMDRDIELLTIATGTPTPDASGTVTAEGAPLYVINIRLNIKCDRENLLSLLKFVEKESVGCYYVQTLQSNPVEVLDSDGKPTGEEVLNSNLSINLYYFNQTLAVPTAPSTDEGAEEG